MFPRSSRVGRAHRITCRHNTLSNAAHSDTFSARKSAVTCACHVRRGLPLGTCPSISTAWQALVKCSGSRRYTCPNQRSLILRITSDIGSSPKALRISSFFLLSHIRIPAIHRSMLICVRSKARIYSRRNAQVSAEYKRALLIVTAYNQSFSFNDTFFCSSTDPRSYRTVRSASGFQCVS